MRNYRDLQVWSKAYALSLELYRLSRTFPKEEIYGITSQMRRSVVSIGANLAEGCGRRTNAEMARFVRIAMGSASELDHHLLLCKDLGFLHDEDYKRTSRNLIEVRKMLGALLESIEGELGIRSKAAAKG
ncbi:MAG TPA: four helix bundle protein [Candidatus Angelobacter sp.]|nr:four helix bundle protein [Candidatus Angelobacter sp.]